MKYLLYYNEFRFDRENYEDGYVLASQDGFSSLTIKFGAITKLNLNGVLFIELDFTGKEHLINQLKCYLEAYDPFDQYNLFNLREWMDIRNAKFRMEVKGILLQAALMKFSWMIYRMAGNLVVPFKNQGL